MQLKQATQREHQMIESSKMFVEVLGKKFTLNAYVNLLQVFFSVYMPLEQKINNFLQEHEVSFKYKEKLPLLIKDLNSINCHHNLEIVKKLSVPDITHLEHFLGCLYVIEGSTLGGMVIHKMVSRHLNIKDAAGFFYPYGLDTKKCWHHTVSFINSFTNSDSKFIKRSCAAAKELFQVLNNAMQ